MKFLLGYPLFLASLLLCSCQHSSSRSKTSNILPDWVTGPAQFCGASSLCGVGSGLSIAQADQRARADIAAYFKTQVTSELQNQQWERQGEHGTEDHSFLETQVEFLLEGAAITQRYIHEDKEFYALAQVKKRTLQARIEQSKNELKETFERIAALRPRFGLIKYEELKHQWRELLFLQRLVQGAAASDDILETAPIRDSKGVWIQITAPEAWKASLHQLVQGWLLQVGHSVVGQRAKAQDVLEVQFTAPTRRVETFLQAKIHLRLVGHSLLNTEQALGLLEWSKDVTARTEDQLQQQVLTQLRRELPLQLYQVGL